MDAELSDLSAALGAAAQQHGLRIATAESCTGGWVAQVITHTAGSSAWFERGFITYSNDAKCELLGVDPQLIAAHGAVSEAVAAAMAQGALSHSHASLSVAVTGIAGPGGGSPDKPVGTVCFAWCLSGQAAQSGRAHFAGSRETVRRQALVHALRGLLARTQRVP